ncbi:MAG: hypothetical protein COA39_011345 [Sulfurimonas sp.]|nr:hypothetical protein [Sulfurimonas sp.]
MNSKYLINATKSSFKDFLLSIEDYFQANKNTIHKARNELKIIKYNNLSTVVKSFKIPNIINKVAYTFFRDSKAKKSYEYSLEIGNFTPQPIGYIEFFKFGLLQSSYFISEEFEYDFTIREPLLDQTFHNRDAIFRAFACFSLELHNAGIYHNDYSPGNILIKKEKENYTFKIVDINRMLFKNLSENERAKNFSKLWADNFVLEIIAQEYTKHFKCSKNFSSKVLSFSDANKRVKNFKKRLKGKPVND